MQLTSDIDALRHFLRVQRQADRSVGLVPTMGALHAGHLALVAASVDRGDWTVMSIFVNPAQFGPGEDFNRYPRTLEGDRDLAERAGVDLLFVPDVASMYPGEQQVWVDPIGLATRLEGERRPGHFRGVCTVVAKLFNLVQPDRAYFGQKDGQQALVVTAMARDLAFPVEIVVVPTVREPDGLALSSRNIYLTPEERDQATAIHRGLRRADRAIRAGLRQPESIVALVREEIETGAPLARIDYIALADPVTLDSVDEALTRDAMLAVAVYFGTTRLIDNLHIKLADGEGEG